MSSIHPKIQVESKHDILFLKKELESSVHAINGSEVASEELTAWINDIFKLASGNIQINGIEYDEAFTETIEYEPLDEVLRSKVSAASDLVSQLTLQVTQLRQSIPQEIRSFIEEESNTFLKSLSEPITTDDELRELCINHGIDWNNLESSLKESTKVLEESIQSVPEMVQKLQRASQVLETLEIPDSLDGIEEKEYHGNIETDAFTPKKGTNSKESRQKLLSALTNGW